jgi:hypothetical protein
VPKVEPLPLLLDKDIHSLLNEHLRSLDGELSILLLESFPDADSSSSDDFLSVVEATLAFLCRQSGDLAVSYAGCMDYIEHMLEKQFVEAIGKYIKQDDINEFIKFHNARLFCPSLRTFCHAIWQPKHSPEGVLSIERENGNGEWDPVDTFAREVTTPSSKPMKVPLNASTSLDLTGKVHLHMAAEPISRKQRSILQVDC